MIKIRAYRYYTGGGGIIMSSSDGSSNPTTGVCTTLFYTSTPTFSVIQNTNHIIYTMLSNTGAAQTYESSATVSSVDATNITLNFDVHQNVTNGVLYIQWEAFA